jgi:hypothetical protein
MQLVFEFGSYELRPVAEAIRRAVRELPYDIQYLPATGTDYIPTNDTLESAEAKLARREISAFSVHPREGMVRYALILKPYFEGQSLSLYLGTIEYTGRDYEPIWDLLLATAGLTFVCLGLEEGVELTDTQLTLETFPWGEWPVVIAALRDTGSGLWTTRKGPGIKSLAGAGGNGHIYDAPV